MKRTGQYAPIDDLQLYYELHGSGHPLALLHGGGSSMTTTYGRILPQLALGRCVIGVDAQAHGRTRDNGRPLSFERDADNLAALLDVLGIGKTDLMGFSNGATTALHFAIRHPGRLGKLVIASGLSRMDGIPPGFFEGFDHAVLDHMPQPLRDGFMADNEDDPDAAGRLQVMFDRDVERMKHFRDIDDDKITTIQAPALILHADRDIVLVEHAVRLFRLMAHARLAVLPGGHEDYLGGSLAVDPGRTLPDLVVTLIQEFLDA
ncbi:MAG TPA: alpha/beta hydrolase [Dinghuibacter sp.]|uniref:alpha/beta fold hydrolase n=1 Tax=Dinghuibacter sp. TaxID=2024697 RepID=UPI002BE89DB5|nr:alpha/beta hydrolase [Dinghuibacter sp.]HTJ12082.1 alpha/beta hydrolase [Dinghuibacter sp.]